jgi:hypothetical protein
MDTATAAQYLHLSPRTLEAYRMSGEGPPYIRVGRGRRSPVLYDVADLNAWLDARRQVATKLET